MNTTHPHQAIDRVFRVVLILSMALSWMTGLAPLPLPHTTVSVAYAAGGEWNVANISLNGLGSSITAPPGSVITVDLDYTIQNPDDWCQSCIRQIVIGIGNEGKYCAYDAVPAMYPSTTSGHSTNTITLPSAPGVYVLTASSDYEYDCATAITHHSAQQSLGQVVAAVHFVDVDATGANNGTSWTDAYTDLQSALAAAISGDEIWVAEGTYKPTTGIDRAIRFQLNNGVKLYGGFAGTETLRSQRNWTTHVTILSGDIGTIGNNSDNTQTVISTDGTDSTTVLDGFTVTGGNADAAWQSGGGMIVNNYASPTVANMIFANNSY
jgi:Protein of unknown function (DUF1565)